MAHKKFGTITVDGVTLLGVTNFSFDADNGVQVRNHTSTKGFPVCLSKTEQTRTFTIEAEDYDAVTGLSFDGTTVASSIEVLGVCGGDDITITGNVVLSDLNLNASENGEIKTATFTGTYVGDGATEPVTMAITIP